MELAHTITSDGYIEFRIKLPTGGSLLSQELAIESSVNAVGCFLTEQSLLSFDTDGSSIKVADITYYSKGVEKKSTNAIMGR
jgi:hypothetical protein